MGGVNGWGQLTCNYLLLRGPVNGMVASFCTSLPRNSVKNKIIHDYSKRVIG